MSFAPDKLGTYTVKRRDNIPHVCGCGQIEA
jgi:hypothetical protein